MIESIRIKDLAKMRGKPKRDCLPPDLEAQAKRLYAITAPYCGSWEKFEFDYCCDENPDKELAVMEKIVAAWQLWCERFPFASEGRKRTALMTGYAISLGMKQFPDAVIGQEMAAYYKQVGGYVKLAVIQ